MPKFFYASDERELLVFWAPKSACTTVVNWFYYGVLGRDVENSPVKDARIILHTEGYDKTISDFYKRNKYRGYRKIFVIRHPVTRLVSGYVNKFVHYRRRMLLNYTDLEDFIKPAVDTIYRKHGWAIDNYRGIRFLDLLEYLEDHIHNAAAVDPHFACQVSEAYDRNRFPFDKICRVERLQEDIDEVNAELGIEYTLWWKNKTAYNTTDGKALFDAFSADLARDNVIPGPSVLLDREIKNRIFKLYRLDFEIGDYDVDRLD